MLAVWAPGLSRALSTGFVGLSDGYWLRVQAAHDTEVAHARLSAELEKIHPGTGPAA